MVFETVIANLLNAYLGHFIDDVNASQLKLGAWRGNVELKNLSIKEDAFASLDLPFKILHGRIGKLTAIIPWSSLYSSPVQLSLHDVYVVAVPNVCEEYDEDIEAERAWRAKQEQLNLIETTRKNLDLQGDQKRKNFNEVAQEDDGFVTKLAAQVIRNVQILITNIHIVYEDKFTDSLNPFQIGLTLNKIVFQTVDDPTSANQRDKYSENQKKELIFKVTSIDYLSIYFNCERNIQFLSALKNGSDIDAILSKRIASTINQTNDRNMDYVLKPVTFRGNLVINSKPEKFDFELPVADIDMILGDFTVHLKKPQLHAITSFMDSVSRIRVAAAFRKFRPSVGVHKHPNEWWQFALSSVLERDIKPHRNNWNWKRMKKHRQKCREYKEIFKEKLLCEDANEKIAIEGELEDYERDLDVFNIVLCRSQAEIECLPELEKRKEKEANEKGGWFSLSGWGLGGWYGISAKAEKETEEIVSGLKREMTQEEKEKLYSAIGYDSSSIGVLDTPKEFVGFIINFKLDSIRCVVTGFDENFRVGEFCMRNINFAVRFRPAAGAAQVDVTFDSTSIMTSNEDPSLSGKSASIDSRRKALAFARSASKNNDEPKTDFSLHLESKSFNFECSYDPKPEGVIMNMTSAVEEIQLTLTNFTSYSYKLPVETKYCILSPCTIRMISQTENNNQVMHVEFSKLDIHMAPQALKIINNVMNAFRGNTEINIVERAPPRASEILQPKILSRDSRFRSKDVVDAAVEVTEDMNMALQAAAKTFVASAPFDTTGNNQREVYLDMRNINFVVEAGIVNPQPLIKFHSSIFGQLQNSNFIKLECQCLLNYYNENKQAWEPMIEPVSYDPYPSGEPVLWKFDMTIDMKEINGQSVMNIELESQGQLDLTITRTAVNVLLSLLDTLSEESERTDAIKPQLEIRHFKSDVHIFKNLLPFCIKYNVIGRDDVHELEAGEECEMEGIRFEKTEIRIKLLDYLGNSWVADNTISGITEDEDFDSWKFFPSASSTYTANSHCLDPIPYNPGHRRTDSSDEYCLTVLLATTRNPKGHVTSTLFCPYWLINKTQLPLAWKFSGRRGYNVVDPGNINYPVLMSFKQKLFSKKKVQIKVGDSELSDSFPIDVVGSKGTVLVKGKNGVFYTVAVHITMSRISLTKIITVHPFYLIINKTKHIIEHSEDNDQFKPAFPKGATPFWPYRLKDLTLCFRFADAPDFSSKPVSLTVSNSCLLSMYDRLVYVTVEVEESEVQVTMEDYFEGCSPILFVNATDDCVITFAQTGSKSKNRLPPMHSTHFTWVDPLGERTVRWSINDRPELIYNPRHDMISMSDDKETCWVSFVDGSQRVLFVTHNFGLASEMMHAIELVQPQMDITLQSRGFGLSLVDDIAGLEIAYLGIAPSDLLWELKQPERRHYQPLPLKDIEVLEAAYQKQKAKLKSRSATGAAVSATEAKTKSVTKLSRKLKVEWPNDINYLDYPILLEPMSGQLRRVKNRGIWGYIGYSEHTTQLHFKLSHMQIDNQMSDCLFSTLMSHIIAPRSVVGEQIPKPFFEFSAIIQRQANLRRFKYLSLLVQEFFIKIEYSFIQHLMEFSNEASTWYYRNYTYKEMIENDLDLVLNSHQLLVDSSTRSNRILYDLIHFSPLKLNVSFSLSSTSADDKDEGVSLPLGLDFILRSAGVTLTEFQDVTFRLDCFERSMVLFTQEQLMWASLDHYKRQILKQIYAVVLGLDVIGNPVSLAMDLKQGVGDFFYEPIQGIIKGPEEAVEGLALGVASLFSHTVGGAIGALSKISGTLGEGISSLTFDDEMKKRRRQRRREQPNIARSGRDLVEGLVGGITGLVTQPVSGAKEDGFEGFMKGVGKGVIGVVTQPATSIVDFATGTLNAIRVCVNEQKGPKRLRPPRVILIGRPLSSYNRFEAEKMLNPMRKRERS